MTAQLLLPQRTACRRSRHQCTLHNNVQWGLGVSRPPLPRRAGSRAAAASSQPRTRCSHSGRHALCHGCASTRGPRQPPAGGGGSQLYPRTVHERSTRGGSSARGMRPPGPPGPGFNTPVHACSSGAMCAISCTLSFKRTSVVFRMCGMFGWPACGPSLCRSQPHSIASASVPWLAYFQGRHGGGEMGKGIKGWAAHTIDIIPQILKAGQLMQASQRRSDASELRRSSTHRCAAGVFGHSCIRAACHPCATAPAAQSRPAGRRAPHMWKPQRCAVLAPAVDEGEQGS